MMHHALEIPEIRSEICLQCSLGTLTSLARTGSVFRDHAQEVIWREIEFFCLIRALPSDVVRIERADLFTVNRVVFLRPIRPETLGDLARLTGHVKAMRYNAPDIAKIPSNLLDALLNTADVPRMFSRLENLDEVFGPGEQAMPYFWIMLHHCLGPNLKSLSMFLRSNPSEALAQKPWLQQLNILCPHLCRLTLNWSSENTMNPTTIDSVSSAICKLDQLRHLAVPALNTTALTYISTLPSLENLSIGTAFSRTEFTPPSIELPTFPSLTELSFTGSLDMCISMVSATASSPLCRLDLTVCTPLSPSCCGRIFSLVASQGSHQSLHDLRLGQGGGWDDSLPPCTLDTLYPLLSLHSMKVVVLSPPSGFSLSDKNMERIASSWPELKILSLQWPNTPNGTVQSLAEFACRCPYLRSLDIPFSASVVPLTRAKPANGATNSSLRDLRVRNAPIVSPSDVALFLSSLFPRLKCIKFNAGLPDGLAWQWDMVQRLVPKFVHARRQERGDWSDMDLDSDH